MRQNEQTNKTIYALMLGDVVFYVGCTSRNISNRLAEHLDANPKLRDLPDWVKRCISIKELEVCSWEHGQTREQHWIKHYKLSGGDLLNGNNYKDKRKYIRKHEYVPLSKDEVKAIQSMRISIIALRIGINPETLRIAIKKNKVKKVYYDAIFTEPLNNQLG